jgi:quercetin dioxygenase-like cupin family protein
MMKTIQKEFSNLGYDALQIKKLTTSDTLEILGISLEKGRSFPEHTSPRDAHLVVLEGQIQFHIQGETYDLGRMELFQFPGDTKHSVDALENSKFLIIR